jgi:PhoH-like ATPase
MNKCYVVDTNILIHAIEFFDDSSIMQDRVIIPLTVICELDRLKMEAKTGELKFKARRAIRKIDELIKNDKIEFYSNNGKCYDLADNDIIQSALEIRESCDIVLVSNDLNMRLKARAVELKTMDYLSESKEFTGLYDGVGEVFVNNDIFQKFANRKPIKTDVQLLPNQCVVVKNEFCHDNTILGIYNPKKKSIERLVFEDCNPNGIKPKNMEQKFFIELIMRDDIRAVTASGIFGSAKTFTAMGTCLHLLETGKYKKIYIAKSPEVFSKRLEIGFLPSDLADKLMPSLIGITSNLKNMDNNKNERLDGKKLLEGYMTFGKIEILSIGHLLGASIDDNSLVIIDESQLLDKDEFLQVASRIGESSKIIFAGDIVSQKGLLNLAPEDTGMYHFIDTMKDSELTGHITMKKVLRSGLARELAEKW